MTEQAHPKARILVVDDEESARQMVERILEDDYDVTLASSADEALRCIEQGSFSAALIDWHMPGDSGEAVVNKLMGDGMRFDRIFLVTADTSKSSVGDAIQYVQKPFEPRELVLRLQNALSGH